MWNDEELEKALMDDQAIKQAAAAQPEPDGPQSDAARRARSELVPAGPSAEQVRSLDSACGYAAKALSLMLVQHATTLLARSGPEAATDIAALLELARAADVLGDRGIARADR